MYSLRSYAPLFVVLALTLGPVLPAAAKRPQAEPPRTEAGPWLHEDAFDADLRLHATVGQTVILDLEGRGDRGGPRHRENVFRLFVEYPIDLGLCIPAGEMRVRSVRWRPTDGTPPRWRFVRPGDPCEPVPVEAGTYELRVVHEAAAVGDVRTSAFVRTGALDPFGFEFLYTIDSSGCTNCKLDQADLSGQSYPGAQFYGSTFHGAVLDGGDFNSARFDDASLEGASIAGADFSGTFLSCTTLSGLDLRESFDAPRGGIVYADSDNAGRLVRIDPATGVRSVISSEEIGGTNYQVLIDVEALDDGRLLTVAIFFDGNGDPTVYRVDPYRGVAEIVSNSSTGSGPLYGSPRGIGQATDGSYILLGEDSRGSGVMAVWRIDPATGDREIVSGPSVGTGPKIGLLSNFDFDDAGNVITTGLNNDQLLSIDLATGDRTVIASSGVGSGPPLSDVLYLVVSQTGAIIATDGIRGIISVDPATGNRTTVSSTTVGSGPVVREPLSIAEDSDGSLLVFDYQNPGLYRVDPATGDRTLISSADVGGGVPLGLPAGVASIDFAQTFEPDFSCRPDLLQAHISTTTFDLEDWRYLDLTDATIDGAPDGALSSAAAPLDLSGALLSGVDLSGATLDAANLGCFEADGSGSVCPAASGTRQCSTLQSTNLSGASLVGACLAGAQLQGSSLSFSNLAKADFTGAQLLGLGGGNPAALTGAFMADAILSGADLTGVNMSNTSFYSASATADATGANMTGARFANAYLAGANFASAELRGTTWSQAVLIGASFTNAQLGKNSLPDQVTEFTGAFLHGAIFTNATVTDAEFTDSYWDLTGTSELAILMPLASLQFTGYWKDMAADEWVGARYETPSSPPLTTSMNVCPDGGLGPCAGKWNDARIPIDSPNVTPRSCDTATGACEPTDVFWSIGGLF